jgi:hypothetical protein
LERIKNSFLLSPNAEKPVRGVQKSVRPIAHRRLDDGATHDLEEHLRAAALLAGKFAEVWGASETAALGALWHDLGKYAAEFQAMITASDPEAHLEGGSRGFAKAGRSPQYRRAVSGLNFIGPTGWIILAKCLRVINL